MTTGVEEDIVEGSLGEGAEAVVVVKEGDEVVD